MPNHGYANPVDALNDYLSKNSPAHPDAIWLQVGLVGNDSRWDYNLRPWTFGQGAAQGGCGLVPINPGNALYSFLYRHHVQSLRGTERLADSFYRIGVYSFFRDPHVGHGMVRFATTNAMEFPRPTRKFIADMLGASVVTNCHGEVMWQRMEMPTAVSPARVGFLKKARNLAREHNVNLRGWLQNTGNIRFAPDSSFIEYTDIPLYARSSLNFVAALLAEGLLVPAPNAFHTIRVCTDCRAVCISDTLCACRKIKFFDSRKSFFFYGKTSPKIPRHIGVELEIGNINYGPLKKVDRTPVVLARAGISGKPDGSLGRDGMEFVTMPVAGAVAEKTIFTLTRELSKFGDTQSYRAGTHIHVDVRDLTNDAQLHNLLSNWDSWESKVFNCLPVARRTNRYCMPNRYMETLRGRNHLSCPDCGGEDPETYYNDEFDEDLTSCCGATPEGNGNPVTQRSYARINRDYIEGIGANERYRALNLQAFSCHKTVEFRFLESTLDGRRIVAAATFLSNLVNDSLAMKEFTPDTVTGHAKGAFEYLSTSIPT